MANFELIEKHIEASNLTIDGPYSKPLHAKRNYRSKGGIELPLTIGSTQEVVWLDHPLCGYEILPGDSLGVGSGFVTQLGTCIDVAAMRSDGTWVVGHATSKANSMFYKRCASVLKGLESILIGGKDDSKIILYLIRELETRGISPRIVDVLGKNGRYVYFDANSLPKIYKTK
jgi:hypothetical protein